MGMLIRFVAAVGLLLTPGPANANAVFEADLNNLTPAALSDPEIQWIHAPRSRSVSGICSAPSVLRLRPFSPHVQGVVIELDLNDTYAYTFDVSGSSTATASGNSRTPEIFNSNKYVSVYNKLNSRRYYGSNVLQTGTLKITLEGKGKYAIHNNDKLLTSAEDSNMFTFPMSTSSYIYLGMNMVVHASYANSRRGRGVCSVRITWISPDFHADLTYNSWMIPANTPEFQWRYTPSKMSYSYRYYCTSTGVLRLVKSPAGATGVRIDMVLNDAHKHTFHLANKFSTTGFGGSGAAEVHDNYKDLSAYRTNKQLLGFMPRVIGTGAMNVTLVTNGVAVHVNNKLVYKSGVDMMFKFPLSGEGIYFGINRLIATTANSGKGLCSFQITWLYGNAGLTRREWSDDEAFIDQYV